MAWSGAPMRAGSSSAALPNSDASWRKHGRSRASHVMRNFISPSRRPAALLIMLWLVFGPNAPARRVTYAAVESFAYTCPVEMRLLVITADGNEAVLGAIKSTLDHLGTPYDIHVAGQPGELTPAMLSDAACHGLYQGVILTTGE